ncbi:MAG: prefoldin subunit [Candidatus Micrarchaeota archaeon]
MKDEELRNQLQEYQATQSQLQMLSMQLQQLTMQENETQKALEEIEKGKGPFYRFVSNILVEKDKESLKKELGEEKETIAMRVTMFKKQEDKLKVRFEELKKTLEQASKAMKGGQAQ